MNWCSKTVEHETEDLSKNTVLADRRYNLRLMGQRLM